MAVGHCLDVQLFDAVNGLLQCLLLCPALSLSRLTAPTVNDNMLQLLEFLVLQHHSFMLMLVLLRVLALEP